MAVSARDEGRIVPRQGALPRDGGQQERSAISDDREFVVLRARVEEQHARRERRKGDRHGRLPREHPPDGRPELVADSEQQVQDVERGQTDHGADPDQERHLDRREEDLPAPPAERPHRRAVGQASHHDQRRQSTERGATAAGTKLALRAQQPIRPSCESSHPCNYEKSWRIDSRTPRKKLDSRSRKSVNGRSGEPMNGRSIHAI